MAYRTGAASAHAVSLPTWCRVVCAQEHDGLLHSLLTPLTSFVMELLPEDSRESTK